MGTFKPNVIVHLAAQAGVRCSLESPRAYLESNIVGTFKVMEASRKLEVQYLLMVSTSSIYGTNGHMPFDELERVEIPLTFYAAAKKANESMAHSYAHLRNLPKPMFRFLPSMVLEGTPICAVQIHQRRLDGAPIDIHNNGDMARDFTYFEDLVRGIRLLIDATPVRFASRDYIAPGDSLSPVAPFRVVNIGNSDKVQLLDFIDAIEEEVGIRAILNYMEMQKGDVCQCRRSKNSHRVSASHDRSRGY